MNSVSAYVLRTDRIQASGYFRLVRLKIPSRFLCQRALKLRCSLTLAKELTIISKTIGSIRILSRTQLEWQTEFGPLDASDERN
eukprot:5548030-Pyramimonas_sp.AAC.1